MWHQTLDKRRSVIITFTEYKKASLVCVDHTNVLGVNSCNGRTPSAHFKVDILLPAKPPTTSRPFCVSIFALSQPNPYGVFELNVVISDSIVVRCLQSTNRNKF